jgi:hypothetical protein
MLYRVPTELSYRSLKPVEFPELAMGVQVVRFERLGIEQVGLLLSGLVVVPLGEGGAEGLQEIFRWHDEWAYEGARRTEVSAFDRWLSKLEEIDRFVGVNAVEDLEGLIENPQPAPPAAPLGGAYGHLPFTTVTKGNDVFYRFEVLPRSTWISQSTGKISERTFAAPASELPFVPSGFAAVGRYALPKLPPYCWRWELQPVAGKEIAVGACVPLYGQAGGGVEVKFLEPTDNRGPIANPVKIPAY